MAKLAIDKCACPGDIYRVLYNKKEYLVCKECIEKNQNKLFLSGKYGQLEEIKNPAMRWSRIVIPAEGYPGGPE